MVKRVVITNYLGESVEYKIEGVDVENNNGLFITEIEGLGPTGADVIFNKLVSVDGSLYNSARINNRNIVIKARYLWGNTTEEARLASYKVFPLKKMLKFEVETDNRKAYTYGYVEKNEPNIFRPDTDVQISVLCESPFFFDSGGMSESSFSCGESLFEFVYENEGHEQNTEFGNLSDKTINTVTYNGETDIGYTLVLHATGSVRTPTVNFISSGDSLTFRDEDLMELTGKTFESGDDIILTMLDDEKSCYFVRNGEFINILNIVADQNFSWPKLTPGPTNIFSCSALLGEDYLRFYIRYQAVYEGV